MHFQKKENSEKEHFKFRKKDWWKYLLAVILILIYLFPFYVIVVMSFKPITDTSSRLSLPDVFYLGNYISLFDGGMILNGIKNSLIITVASLLIEVILGSMAAYPLSRNQSKFNEKIRMIIMGVMMISPLSVLVGVYSILSGMGAISTYWGLVLVVSAFGLPMAIYLYSNFISSIPKALDEAAEIDGANHLQIFWHIILPQLKTVTVTVIILQGVGLWNEYTYSLYVMQKQEMFTITLVIKSYFSQVATDYGGAAAAACIGMLPVVIAYLFLQKYFIQGSIDSAVK